MTAGFPVASRRGWSGDQGIESYDEPPLEQPPGQLTPYP